MRIVVDALPMHGSSGSPFSCLSVCMFTNRAPLHSPADLLPVWTGAQGTGLISVLHALLMRAFAVRKEL